MSRNEFTATRSVVNVLRWDFKEKNKINTLYESNGAITIYLIDSNYEISN